MKTLNSNNVDHLEDSKGQLGICICSMGYGKSLTYKGHKYKSIEEMMEGQDGTT